MIAASVCFLEKESVPSIDSIWHNQGESNTICETKQSKLSTIVIGHIKVWSVQRLLSFLHLLSNLIPKLPVYKPIQIILNWTVKAVSVNIQQVDKHASRSRWHYILIMDTVRK